MSIVISEKIVGIWLVNLDNESDWLGAVEKTEEGHKLTYRFRYYVDDKTHDSEDRKNWYGGDITGQTDEHIVDVMRQVTQLMAKRFDNAEIDEILMGNKNLDEFMKEFTDLPATHVVAIEKLH